MELAEQFQRHGLRPGAELRRTIAEHIDQCQDLRGDPDAARRFVGLLCARRGVYETLDSLPPSASCSGGCRNWARLTTAFPTTRSTSTPSAITPFRWSARWSSPRESQQEELAELRRAWSEVEAPETALPRRPAARHRQPPARGRALRLRRGDGARHLPPPRPRRAANRQSRRLWFATTC